MQSNVFKFIATFLLLIFLFSSISEVAATGKPQFVESNGKVDVTTDQATISVTGGGNIPFFHIQLNNSKTAYEVKFSSIEEFVDTNGDGMFQQSEAVPNSGISLPSLNWAFSGFSNATDSNNNIQTLNFNFTTSSSSKGPVLGLRNHIDVSKGNQLKFDLSVGQYTWTSNNDTAKLAVKFQIAGGNLTQGSSSNDLSFGDAQFNSVSTAQTPDGNINVHTEIASGNSFYLIYDHFKGNFTHDPTFSVVAGSSSGNASTGVSLGLLPILGGLAVIGIVYTKKRRI